MEERNAERLRIKKIAEGMEAKVHNNTEDSLDCKWKKWSNWGPCSESCGNGFMVRVRNNTAGQSGKETCIGSNKETKKCQIRYNNCTDIDDCKPNPCQNGGICEDELGNYSCNCVNEY